MSFKKEVVANCKQGDALLEHKDALVALQTAVDSKKVKKTFTHSDFEEMKGKDLSISLINSGDKIGGIMFNLKNPDAIKKEDLRKVEGLSGIMAVESDEYAVANELNTGKDEVYCIEIRFDGFYPTTAYNMRRIAGIIDIALGKSQSG